MTLINREPGHDDRVKMRARFVRFHPKLRAQLFHLRIEAITDNWPMRPFIAGVCDD